MILSLEQNRLPSSAVRLTLDEMEAWTHLSKQAKQNTFVSCLIGRILNIIKNTKIVKVIVIFINELSPLFKYIYPKFIHVCIQSFENVTLKVKKCCFRKDTSRTLYPFVQSDMIWLFISENSLIKTESGGKDH